jgi:hypothetical protein
MGNIKEMHTIRIKYGYLQTHQAKVGRTSGSSDEKSMGTGLGEDMLFNYIVT